jgi:hypothetical protein
MLNTSLWIAQGLVAVVVALAGGVKLIVPREALASKMHWAASWPRWQIKLLGLAEVAGAAGLVVPQATGIAPLLTPVAGACLAVLMGGAVGTHVRLDEAPAAPAIIGAVCIGIAAGRLLLGAQG